MDNTIKRYKDFLNRGKTERECIKEIISLCKENGYKDIESVDSIKAGDKVYYSQYGKAIALFSIDKSAI